MGDHPTDLLGWADEMDRVADMCRDEGFSRRIEEGNRALAALLRRSAAENAALRERVAVLERREPRKKRKAHAELIEAATSAIQFMSRCPECGGYDLARARERLSKALAAAKPAAQEGKETT